MITNIEVFSKEASMRTLPVVAVLALLPRIGRGCADRIAERLYRCQPDAPNKAFGGPRTGGVYPGAGRDDVGPDGISTKVVKAAPCSTAARETDGTTTCTGIPGPVRGGGNSPEDTTTGMAPPR
jgi:hypothetical protein